MSIISEADVFNAISDKKSLDLSRSIVMTKAGDTDIYRKKIKLTRKQYYSRVRMIKVGLIKRKNRKYFLTSLGKVVYEAESIIESALNDYWKLKAIDSLEGDGLNMELPTEEHSKILDTLIANQNIKLK